MEINEIIIGKDIFKFYKQTYYATNDGKIANIVLDKEGCVIKFNLLKQETSNFGHRRIELHIDKKPIKMWVHRIVYEVWIGELKDGMVIEHLDGNPSNNSINNLKQSTQKQNIHTAMQQGTFGHNNETYIIVYDKLKNTTKEYECIRDFLKDINAPEYMIKHGGLGMLNKRAEYKNRFVIEKIGRGRKGKGQQTTESVDSEKDVIE